MIRKITTSLKAFGIEMYIYLELNLHTSINVCVSYFTSALKYKYKF